MLVFENIIGVLAVLMTAAAYYQVNRIRFLKLNVLAVSFFGLSLLFNQGFSGAAISFLNVGVYIFAIFSGEKVLNRASFIIPPIAFTIAYWFYSSGVEQSDISISFLSTYLPFIPAVATFVVSLSALQHNIVRNKWLLFFGVTLWALYSFLVTAWYALAADILGLFVIIISLGRLARLKTDADKL